MLSDLSLIFQSFRQQPSKPLENPQNEVLGFALTRLALLHSVSIAKDGSFAAWKLRNKALGYSIFPILDGKQMWYFSAISCLWKFWSSKQQRKFLDTARTHGISWRVTCANPRPRDLWDWYFGWGEPRASVSSVQRKLQKGANKNNIIDCKGKPRSFPTLTVVHSISAPSGDSEIRCLQKQHWHGARSIAQSKWQALSALPHRAAVPEALRTSNSNDWMAGLIVFRCLWCIVMYCDWVWIHKSIMRSAFRFWFLAPGSSEAKSLIFRHVFSLCGEPINKKSSKNECENMKSIANHRSQIRPQPDQESRTCPFRLWNDVLSSGCGRGTYRRRVQGSEYLRLPRFQI